MATLERRALEQALTILKGLDARFWIRLPTGEEYGERPQRERESATKRERKPSVWPRGELVEYYHPLLESLEPGETRRIDCKAYEHSLQNSITGWASKRWGPGSYLSQYDKETNTLSIMRIL